MNTERGFTLVEMAVVLLVLTLLLGGLLVPLSTQVEQRKVSDTLKILEDAKETLLGFAVANGRLPCPASSTSKGLESFCVDGNPLNACVPTTAPQSHGRCSNFYDGFFPAASLGFTPVDESGFALDGWGLTQNRIRYAVANKVSATDYPFTQPDGMKNVTMSTISTADLLYVCGSAPSVLNSCGGTPNTLTNKAVVVVYSVGKNAATGGTGTDESVNANPNNPSKTNPVFVSHTQSAAVGNEFDDIVTWLSPNILFNRMVAAGRLP
jgi:prepilin-type N-terminal cleavage/methylation domain-containing protein